MTAVSIILAALAALLIYSAVKNTNPIDTVRSVIAKGTFR